MNNNYMVNFGEEYGDRNCYSSRFKIEKVYFERLSFNDIEEGLKKAIKVYDFSDVKKGGKVTAWLEKIESSDKFILHISSTGKIIFPNDCSLLFSGYIKMFNFRELEEIRFDNIDTHLVTNMESMFSALIKIKKLNLNVFDTKNVIDMSNMFESCHELEVLDLNNFETNKVTCMEEMFFECFKLRKVLIDNFDTKNVVSTACMFCRCQNLKDINLSKFKTNNLRYAQGMFYDCCKLNKKNICDNLLDFGDLIWDA